MTEEAVEEQENDIKEENVKGIFLNRNFKIFSEFTLWKPLNNL